MKETSLLYNQFEIKIDFERGHGDPARVFRTMSGLVESIQSFDQHLSATISTKIQTTLILEDIKGGSMLSVFRTMVESVPDEVLKDGEIKKILGHFLCHGKHVLLDWCSKRNAINNRSDVKELEGELLELAEKTKIKQLPAYAPIEIGTLLSDISSVRDALVNLEEEDSAVLISKEMSSNFNKNLKIPEDIVREFMTKETIDSSGEKIFKVKKPDYLGKSQWEFKYANHQIFAKILDEQWLNNFQSSVIKLYPQDSIRAKVREETFYGFNNEIIHINYEVIKVTEIIPAPKFIQGDLF
jgi:hypothetical protein